MSVERGHRVRRHPLGATIDGSGIGITLGATEHVLTVENAEALMHSIAGVLGTCPPMARPSALSCRAALRIVAQSICHACDGPTDEPCGQCLQDAPRLIGRFLAALPQDQAFTPAELAAAMKRSGRDG